MASDEEPPPLLTLHPQRRLPGPPWTSVMVAKQFAQRPRACSCSRTAPMGSASKIWHRIKFSEVKLGLTGGAIIQRCHTLQHYGRSAPYLWLHTTLLRRLSCFAAARGSLCITAILVIYCRLTRSPKPRFLAAMRQRPRPGRTETVVVANISFENTTLSFWESRQL